MTVLVTGAAGFIGFHLTRRLLRDGISVVGLDSLNSYYDPSLKRARLEDLYSYAKNGIAPFSFVEGSLEDRSILESVFSGKSATAGLLDAGPPKKVVNLAAQAGVLYSIEHPESYISSNLVGFLNVLECCRNHCIEHLVYASSSSVYGGNTTLPFAEYQSVDHPVSLYAATKENELMAHTYSHLYAIPATGLRFFTVYGPWDRPAMALFLFTKAIIEDKPIQLFNQGRMVRDFTYIDDGVEAVVRDLDKPPKPDPGFDTRRPSPNCSWSAHRIFNVGNSNPTLLIRYVVEIKIALDVAANKQLMPMQPGDVVATAADTSSLEKWIGFKPSTTVEEGVGRFVEWYRDFYGA